MCYLSLSRCTLNCALYNIDFFVYNNADVHDTGCLG